MLPHVVNLGILKRVLPCSTRPAAVLLATLARGVAVCSCTPCGRDQWACWCCTPAYLFVSRLARDPWAVYQALTNGSDAPDLLLVLKAIQKRKDDFWDH